MIIVRSGEVLTIYRAPTSVAEMIERLRVMPAVPEIERREADEPSERLGL